MNAQNEQLITQFKALADPVRLRLVALCTSGECTVSELTRIVGQSQPRVSQHLKILCDSGLLRRFRDGQFVYYRVPGRGREAQVRRRLMELVADEPAFGGDLERLRKLRAPAPPAHSGVDEEDRQLYRHLVDLTLASPLGDLLDVGCGRGDVLKLLATRAHRAVGVDIDRDARRIARAELLTAGIPNCTLRQGDMYALEFPDASFDTVVLDDVLFAADEPGAALTEAGRLLAPGGRLIVLAGVTGDPRDMTRRLTGWSASSRLRLATPRFIPGREPRWLLAVATHAGESEVAA